MSISVKDIFASRKLKKQTEDIVDVTLGEPDESDQVESQEEFRGEEANETTDETEAENEVESNSDAKTLTEEETQDETDSSKEEQMTPDSGEVDNENDLETTKDDDHISDQGKATLEKRDGLSVIRKRMLLERMRKLKGN